MHELWLSTSTFAAIVGSLAAIFSARCAFFAYRLSTKIHNDLKSDEEIIIGPPQRPRLKDEYHSQCVIVCTLFNKSRRKAYVSSVCAIDAQGREISIAWSSSIDTFGNPQNPFCLEGLVNRIDLYVRRRDGEAIDYMSLKIHHSFSDSPKTVVYNPSKNWLP